MWMHESDAHIYYLGALVVLLLQYSRHRRHRRLHEIFGNDAAHQLQCLVGRVTSILSLPHPLPPSLPPSLSSPLFLSLSFSRCLRPCLPTPISYIEEKLQLPHTQTVANNGHRSTRRTNENESKYKKKIEEIKINTQNNNVQLKLAEADSTSAAQ